jgi:hypothetical protein
MNKPFNLIRLYHNLDKWKLLYRKQILSKHKLKYKYNILMSDYKDILIQNKKLKRENNDLKQHNNHK